MSGGRGEGRIRMGGERGEGAIARKEKRGKIREEGGSDGREDEDMRDGRGRGKGRGGDKWERNFSPVSCH